MNYPLLYQWEQEIATHLDCFNSWQVVNVALFSYGIIRAESCQQSQVARQVSCGEQMMSTVRRWQRFLDNGSVSLVDFGRAWTRWVVGHLPGKGVTLLVDETKLGDRLAVMMVGVAWEGRCIPLAWRVYPANSKAGYPAEGQVAMITSLLQQVKAGMPADKAVLVQADRGIGTSPDLCRAVAGLGWSYLFRVTCQTKIVTAQGDYAIAQQVQPGDIWCASGLIFKQRGRIPAYARARWQVGYDEPWALVTNDERLTGDEYARRNWQEQSFRDLKSGGWQWGQSDIRQPDHMERLLVLLAVAYGWVVALGSQAVAAGQAQPLHRRLNGQPCRPRRQWSLFKEGLAYFTNYVQRYTVCLTLVFIPDKRFT